MKIIRLRENPASYEEDPLCDKAKTLSPITISLTAHVESPEEIEEVRKSFIDYCRQYSDRYSNWMQAWRDFLAGREEELHPIQQESI